MVKDGPKSGPRSPKSVPRAAQECPKAPKSVPRTAQDSLGAGGAFLGSPPLHAGRKYSPEDQFAHPSLFEAFFAFLFWIELSRLFGLILDAFGLQRSGFLTSKSYPFLAFIFKFRFTSFCQFQTLRTLDFFNFLVGKRYFFKICVFVHQAQDIQKISKIGTPKSIQTNEHLFGKRV